MATLIDKTIDFILSIALDDEYRVLFGSSIVIAICLAMIYKNISSEKSLLRQQKAMAFHPTTIMTQTSVGEVTEGLLGAVDEVREFVAPRRTQRFRKRDRMWFYGRRLARKVEENVGYVQNVGLITAELGTYTVSSLVHPVSQIAKTFLGDESSSVHSEDSFIRPQEDWLDEESDEHWVEKIPSELKYLLNSFHMFGQFDPSVFVELCPAIETVSVPAGQFLFKIGDPDEFIFVVQSGRMDVTITDHLGMSSIKRVGAGDSVGSLLSFLDVLTGHANPFKTVQARAEVDSVVLKLPAAAFLPILDARPELLVRIVQMIMARTQRVFFVALHRYLGLSSELIKPEWVESVRTEKLSYSDGSNMSLDEELEKAANGTEEMMLAAGVRGIQAELGLNDNSYLWKAIEVRKLDKGEDVMTEMSHRDVALVFIIKGELTLYQLNDDKYEKLHSANRGMCVGQLNILSGEASCYTCRAGQPSIVALLTKNSFYHMMTETPEIVLSLAHSTLIYLSPLARELDFALDWITVEGGRNVSSPGMNLDNVYILLSGRLRGYTSREGGDKSTSEEMAKSTSYRLPYAERSTGFHKATNKSAKQLVGEFGRGDMVGVVDVITGINRQKSYLAVRDSELCLIPAQMLTFLQSRSAAVMAKLITVLGDRLTSGYISAKDSKDKPPVEKYGTVAVFPTSHKTPITAFCLELQHSLSGTGPITLISSSDILAKLGPKAFDSSREYRLSSWLGHQEDHNTTVVYQCDPTATPWTRKCLRHADVVFILALVSEGPEVTEAEKELEQLAKRTRKDLIMLHASNTDHPRGTRDWLKKRPWISANFHIKMPPRMMKRKIPLRIYDLYGRVMEKQPDIHSDTSRLARYITGASIGLVLGGGGARGAAHLGMLQSIIEAGIPIDKVGGVSIGAFMTAMWATHRDLEEINERAKIWFGKMHNWRGIIDLTYPITSIFKGTYFNNATIEALSEDLDIEDLWIPFYCISTNVSRSRQRLHTSGSLWSYVRASMSYAWILPPICDPVDGDLLMDGCYVNNVPGDIMLNSGCEHILVVDVTAPDPTDLTNYGVALSGWWLLWKKLNPFSRSIKVPDQSEIQQRLAFCSHYKNLGELTNNPNYEYIQPPVGHFSSSKFELFKEIRAAGYHHGNTFFAGLRKAGDRKSSTACRWLPTTNIDRYRARDKWTERTSGKYTFTDLAEMVVSEVRGVRRSQGSTQLNGSMEGIRRSPGATQLNGSMEGVRRSPRSIKLNGSAEGARRSPAPTQANGAMEHKDANAHWNQIKSELHL